MIYFKWYIFNIYIVYNEIYGTTKLENKPNIFEGYSVNLINQNRISK